MTKKVPSLETFLTAPYLENVDAHVLYDLRNTLEHVGNILANWNARKVESKEAMGKVWSLLKPLSMKAWREMHKEA